MPRDFVRVRKTQAKVPPTMSTALQTATPLDRWQPLVNPSNGWQGMLVSTLVVAALLTCVAGLVLLWRYRQRVKDWMMLSSLANTPSSSPNAGHELTMRWIDTTDSEAQAVQALMRMAQDMPASGPAPLRQAA
jgi:hypothetical protein